MLPHTAKTSHRRVVWQVQMGIGVLNAPTHRKDKSSQGSMAGADGDSRTSSHVLNAPTHTAKTSHRRVVWRVQMGIVVLNAPTHRKDKSSQGSMAGADGDRRT